MGVRFGDSVFAAADCTTAGRSPNVTHAQVWRLPNEGGAGDRQVPAGIGEGTDMCWTRTGVRIPPVNSPARLFNALFTQSSQSEINLERKRLTHRGSVLDALMGSAKSLQGKINGFDRDKLDQYLTSVREVELRLQNFRFRWNYGVQSRHRLQSHLSYFPGTFLFH